MITTKSILSKDDVDLKSIQIIILMNMEPMD